MRTPGHVQPSGRPYGIWMSHAMKDVVMRCRLNGASGVRVAGSPAGSNK